MTLYACFRMANSKCMVLYEVSSLKVDKEIKILNITNITDEKYNFSIWLTKDLTDEVAKLIKE